MGICCPSMIISALVFDRLKARLVQMSIDRAKRNLAMAADHAEAAALSVKWAREAFERVVASKWATADQKYEAAVLLDECTEREAKIAEVERKLQEFRSKIG